MIIMRYSLALAPVFSLLGAITVRGDDVIPSHSNFDRYLAMVDRSPFAIATAVALPAATPDFAKDLYVANAARSPEGDMVTIVSISDQNFKKYLTTGQAVDGYDIASIEWSDRVGDTKVTISKDGKFATLTFNQALLSQRGSPNVPSVPGQMPKSMPVMPSLGMTESPGVRSSYKIKQKPGAPASNPQELQERRQQQVLRQQRQREGKLEMLRKKKAASGRQ